MKSRAHYAPNKSVIEAIVRRGAARWRGNRLAYFELSTSGPLPLAQQVLESGRQDAFRQASDVSHALASMVIVGSLPGRGRSSSAAIAPSTTARSTQR